jgi:predicted CXXCH cytochrome family protein
MSNNVRMSQLTRSLLAVAIVGSGFALYHDEAVAAAGISSTKHNLSATSGSGNRTTGASGEICVFCHTPHGGDTTVAGAPLWNKRIQTTGASFQPYASNTIDGDSATGGSSLGAFVGGASLACLSCHDGTQSIDNLLNAPGSGFMDSTGGGDSGRAYTWTAGGNNNLSASNMLTGNAGLGRDLRNDHPIGIQYCGGGPRVGNLTGTCADTDFRAPANDGTQFWVDTPGVGTTNTREKTDMLLYVRSFTAGDGPSVECASCHDVHSTNTLFLRVSNDASAVCLACHTK